MTKTCGCDCCDYELTPGSAQADGYCPFCAENCYPAALLPNGEYTRVRFDRPSRELLHGAVESRVETVAEPNPMQPVLEQAADMLGRAVAPHVDRLAKQMLKKILR